MPPCPCRGGARIALLLEVQSVSPELVTSTSRVFLLLSLVLCLLTSSACAVKPTVDPAMTAVLVAPGHGVGVAVGGGGLVGLGVGVGLGSPPAQIVSDSIVNPC